MELSRTHPKNHGLHPGLCGIISHSGDAWTQRGERVAETFPDRLLLSAGVRVRGVTRFGSSAAYL